MPPRTVLAHGCMDNISGYALLCPGMAIIMFFLEKRGGNRGVSEGGLFDRKTRVTKEEPSYHDKG